MKSKQRILIIKWGALGDIAIAAAHIDAIAKAYPEAEVWLLTTASFAPLFAHDHRLRLWVSPRRGFRAMSQCIWTVMRRRFDAVFDLQGNSRSAVVTLCSGARLRIGLGPKFGYNKIPATREQRDRHIFERLNGLLWEAGIRDLPSQASLAVGSEETERVDQWLRDHAIADRPLVLLHAGASRRWQSKRWPAEFFIVLSRKLSQLGFAIVWIGGADDAELNRSLASEIGIDATGAFSFLDLVALGRRARFAITNDSGPMHILACSGISIFAFFGPTDWRRSHAVGQKERVLRNPVPCSPCRNPVCPPEMAHACLRGITPDQVLNRIKEEGLLG